MWLHRRLSVCSDWLCFSATAKRAAPSSPMRLLSSVSVRNAAALGRHHPQCVSQVASPRVADVVTAEVEVA